MNINTNVLIEDQKLKDSLKLEWYCNMSFLWKLHRNSRHCNYVESYFKKSSESSSKHYEQSFPCTTTVVGGIVILYTLGRVK